MKKKVVIGMSGGVDSSVAAYLLIEKGYKVIGITMKLMDDKILGMDDRQDGCCSLSAVEDARRVCNKLDIPFYVLDFKKVFEEKVVEYFVDEYFHGRTPNPCIACNKYIKFDALLKKAQALEADFVATGHYARISYDDTLDRYLLKKSATTTKDQTYALYNLNQYQLGHTLMPLGDYTKEKVREIAEGLDLYTAHKPDSQEICFVEDNDYGRFLTNRKGVDIDPGNFVDEDGNILGRHKGIIHYTIGQRKGLGISAGKRMYVTSIIPEKNIIVLSDDDQVYKKGLIANNLNFIPFDDLKEPIEARAKIRYSAEEADAIIEPIGNNKVKVRFIEPQRAITPGQAVVFYRGDLVLGGGTIISSL